ncbi:type IV toxin-antitoxin system AbiEi family antitoxin domain-containing protein [Nocardioides mesophilus]|uniref:Type IV toxin-antitoxin system AbiEi family antitoxin domain-containing protein n=1 Tax=Nocardioides mesophilus TaxID=433659 RepID=A0A7G9RF88_9ACTN|nr:type IV toxin-antitoxin system AbiEi family antitoxin domain-containing protein [Nocardioides mesophilus]QNN54263.1 type IV toxin-antitoxin system AbiEi family antitoxin domain-containing protein [Nocardioides mesophilus]
MAQPSLFTDGPLLGADFPLPLDRPFTTRQAADLGVSRSVLSRLHRTGYVRRLLKGVFVAAQVPDTLTLRVQALQLVVPAGTVIVDWTAVWLYTGCLPFGHHLEVPPVSVFRLPGRGRLRNGLCVSGERDLRPGDVTMVDDLTVTTPLRTAWDVGRLSHRDLAMAGLDCLLRTAYFGKDELTGGVERFGKRRGVVQLRELAPKADGRAESTGESVLRLRWLDMSSLPPPRPQVPILDDSGRELYRLDLGVEEIRFAAEYDGEEFHTSDADRAHDRARREWIEQHRGWIIEPVRRENVFGLHRDVESILSEGIARARRKLGSSGRG